MRVGKHAHIKHIVGIEGHAALECKRLEHQRQLGGRSRDQRLHVALQLRGTDHARVEHMRLLAHFAEQLAFQLNGIHQCPVLVGGIDA